MPGSRRSWRRVDAGAGEAACSHSSRELDGLRAELCARVENDWVGAQTGMLDQLASLYGAVDTALCIDFKTLRIEQVPLRLDGWRFVVGQFRRAARERELWL